MNPVKLSVIVPVYNEERTLRDVLGGILAENHPKEVIVIDDGSTDGTAGILAGISDPRVRVIRNEANRGKGHCLRQGMRLAGGDIVVIQDADQEYYPDEYGLLIDKIVQGKADAVYGSRFSGAHRVFYFYHYLGNLVLNTIANVVLNTTLTDLMTGAKAFKADMVKGLRLEADRFGIEVEMTVELFRRKARVYEVPVSYCGRTYEEGKKIKWYDFFSCLYWLIRASLRKVERG